MSCVVMVTSMMYHLLHSFAPTPRQRLPGGTGDPERRSPSRLRGPGALQPPGSGPCPGPRVEPTVTVEPLWGAPRVAEDGEAPVRESGATVFETVFALDIPTRLPWLGFTLEAIIAPFGRTSENPFTGGTAARAASTTAGSRYRSNPSTISPNTAVAYSWCQSSSDI